MVESSTILILIYQQPWICTTSAVIRKMTDFQ